MSMVQSNHAGSPWHTACASSAAKQCDLCDGTRFAPIADRDRDGKTLHTGLCLGCGLVCHMTVPSQAELAQFYARDYRQAYHGETSPSTRRVMRAWKNAQRIYRQLAPYLRSTDSVFEVGAGIGCNVKMFETRGHRASGIEPHRGFQRFSARQLLARVACGDLFDMTGEQRFDLVLLIHVIEHFRSPRQALERIHGLVRPGGRLYVECPNLAAPFARRGQMFHVAHIHNFTPATLRAMAQRCGYDVEHVFSDEGDPNLQMLLRRRAVPATPPGDPHQAAQTLAAIHRYNVVTYHLRPRYVRERVAKLAAYFGERLLARAYVRRLLAQLQPGAGQPIQRPRPPIAPVAEVPAA